MVTWCRAISISVLRTRPGRVGKVGVMGVVSEESGIILMGDLGGACSIIRLGEDTCWLVESINRWHDVRGETSRNNGYTICVFA